MTYIQRLLMALTILTICGCENKKIDEREQLEVERLSMILKEKREEVLTKLENGAFVPRALAIEAELIDDALQSESRTRMVVLLSKIKDADLLSFNREAAMRALGKANESGDKTRQNELKMDVQLQESRMEEILLPLWNRYLKMKGLN